MTGGFAHGTISACVFDAYGTLFDVNAAVDRCRKDLGDRADAIAELWRRKQLEYSWLVSLRGDYVDFWHITGHALDYAMSAFGLSDAALRCRLMELYFVLDAYPDAVPLLQRLKHAHLRTAILSNGSPSMLLAAARSAALDELLDAIVSVDPARIYKPHPNVYQLAVDQLAIPAERICFVSANGWDASGAAHFGFQVVWINRLGLPAEVLPGLPRFQIQSLSELPALLGV